MEEIHEFLKKTETHFNWDLHSLDVTELNWIEKFREKIKENCFLDDPSDMIWPLKLTYAFELFATDKDECNNVADGVIEEIYDAQDGLTCKYRTSYVHIALSFKAFVLIRSHELCESKVAILIKRIKTIADMSQIEKSAVLAMKAQVLRYYGPNGTYKCVPLQREAIRLNPGEIEFKLSLVVSMNRKRHYDRTLASTNTWSTVEEPVNIIEQLLNHSDLTSQQRVSCEYLLAVAYHDFIVTLKYTSPEYEECKTQILKSCNWIHDKTDHPQIISFCADRFFYLEKNKSKGLRILEEALKRFPFHVGLNTTASKFYEATKNLNFAAKHAQTALDKGGFGAAWLLLRQKTKLNEFKHDVVRGARHIEMALDDDPSYSSLQSAYSSWISKTVRPLEMAFGMIVEELNVENHSKEDLSTLHSSKAKIEEFADVDTFDSTYYRNVLVPVGWRVGDSQESSGGTIKTANANTRKGDFYSQRSDSGWHNGGNKEEGAPHGRAIAPSTKTKSLAGASKGREVVSEMRYTSQTSGATRDASTGKEVGSEHQSRASYTQLTPGRKGAPNRQGISSNCKTSFSAGASNGKEVVSGWREKRYTPRASGAITGVCSGRDVATVRRDGTYTHRTSGANGSASTNNRNSFNTRGTAPSIDRETYHREAGSNFRRGANKSRGDHAAEEKYYGGRGGFAPGS